MSDEHKKLDGVTAPLEPEEFMTWGSARRFVLLHVEMQRATVELLAAGDQKNAAVLADFTNRMIKIVVKARIR